MHVPLDDAGHIRVDQFRVVKGNFLIFRKTEPAEGNRGMSAESGPACKVRNHFF